MIISLGIDPDVHTCAVARITISKTDLNISVWIVRNNKAKGREAALGMAHTLFDTYLIAPLVDVLTVEGQDIRYAGKTNRANPQDLCNLALVTGAAYACIPARVKYSPLPSEWKGSVPKHVKQCRILDGLGIKYCMAGGNHLYPIPLNFEQYCVGKVNAGDWKDLTDALGLAVWGLEKYKKENQ